MRHFITELPKAELHVHLLGTMQPAQLLRFAERNHVELPWKTINEVQQAYQSYHDLASFLEVYNKAGLVMQNEQDFYELLYAYLCNATKQNVLHVELFFEAQTYLPRGISFETIIAGLDKARIDAQQAFGIRCELLLCFLRDYSQEPAMEILEQSLDYKDKIIGIGLAGNEKNNPPSKFIKLYKLAKEYGYKLCCHAGEEAGPDYIWEALELLHVDRIDHGIACMQDPRLVAYLNATQIPLTVCPRSNIKLNLFKTMEMYPLKEMLTAGLLVSINSDDPAFFGSLNENFHTAQDDLCMSNNQLIVCARNSFLSAFISAEEKQNYIDTLRAYIDTRKNR